MTYEPVFSSVPVEGGDMRVSRWGNGPILVLGIHGVGASAWSFLPVAKRLPPEFTLIAPDLRGRGASVDLPPPYGLKRHADDCAAVIRAFGPRAIVLGASMGASVGNVLAANHPDVVDRLLALDMGAPLPLPPGMTAEEYRAVVLGPSLQRLRMPFESRAQYLDFWRVHPAISEEWTEDIQEYLVADLIGTEPELRVNVAGAAVEYDSIDQMEPAPDLTASLPRITCPVHLIRAPRNLVNAPQPLVSEGMLAFWRSQTPQLTDEMVDDCNHYTLILGERGTKTIVERLTVG